MPGSASNLDPAKGLPTSQNQVKEVFQTKLQAISKPSVPQQNQTYLRQTMDQPLKAEKGNNGKPENTLKAPRNQMARYRFTSVTKGPQPVTHKAFFAKKTQPANANNLLVNNFRDKQANSSSEQVRLRDHTAPPLTDRLVGPTSN